MSTPSATPTVDGLTLEDATKKWEDFKSARKELGLFADPDFYNKFLLKNVAFLAILLSCLLIYGYEEKRVVRGIAIMLALCMVGLLIADGIRYWKEKNLKDKFQKLSEVKSKFPGIIPDGVTDIYSPF